MVVVERSVGRLVDAGENFGVERPRPRLRQALLLLGGQVIQTAEY